MSLDLGRFYQVSDPNDAGVGDFLTQLRQYDPNASYVATPQITNSDGTTNGTIYQLSFNPSKLPGVDGTGQLSQATSSAPGSAYSSGGGVNFFQGDAGGKIIDPSRTVHSPTYGDVNTFGNVQLPETHSWLDYAPLAVLAFGGALGGFGAGGLLGGASDAGAGGAGFDFGAGAAGTDAGNAIGLGGTPGFDFGAGASGSDVGNAIGLDGNYGGMTQADWDKIISEQPENGSFVGPNGTDPNGFTPADYRDLEGFNASLDNPFSLQNLGQKLPGLLQKLPGLLGGAGAGSGAGGGSGGGGGGNLLINAGGQQQRPQTEDAAAILARLYGQHAGLLGARNG